jgi:FkbM family methyltransferase
MKTGKLNILDVGCRYGVYPDFKKNIKLLNYFGVDCDPEEIIRLKKKYKKQKNIKFNNVFLSNKNKNIKLYVPEHKGYMGSKKINNKSIWFGKIRKEENKIDKTLTIKAHTSSGWLKKNKIKQDIIKLDIEGSEKDFLNGLTDKNFKNTSAILIEMELDKTYHSQATFGDVDKILLKKDFVNVKMEILKEKINIFHNNDLLPNGISSIYVKRKIFYPDQLNEKEQLKFINICYILELNALLFEILQSNTSLIRNNKNNLYNESIKKMVGTHINKLLKDVTIDRKYVRDLYYQIFSSNIPKFNKFNEDDFFNS